MRLICDLHVHSRYSRACSPDMQPTGLDEWSRRKGIDVVGTGDFLHPMYLKELHAELEEAEPGLYKLRAAPDDKVRFLLSVEVSLIYRHSGKVRKVHHVLLAPDLAAAARLQASLGAIGNLAADGRPILGISSSELLERLKDCDARCELIPAHAWTPWFSIFGSQSGYDSLEECFGGDAKHIFALETGLSSDRPMNRRLSALDRLSLISSSDAHSPAKLGREASVLQTERSYDGVIGALKDGTRERFPMTLEFFPEEGKYHHDGHRLCGVCLHPSGSKRLGGLCPVCGKPLTLGVLHRIEGLADRGEAAAQEMERGRQVNLVPLEELIAAAFGCGVGTKRVRRAYLRLTDGLGPELELLLSGDPEAVGRLAGEEVGRALHKMRTGGFIMRPGFDGQYGHLELSHDMK